MSKLTPMVKQYLQIKEQHQDAILFFRLGDFYEMFFDDAEVASRELEIVLTSRENGGTRMPMCGVPFHSADSYIARLIGRGYKIAICEQVEDPKQVKGLVKREVVRIITPGTVMDDSMLDESSNNYLAAVVQGKEVIGFAYADISTGDFRVTEITGNESRARLEGELGRLTPAECLVADWSSLGTIWEQNWHLKCKTMVSDISAEEITVKKAERILLDYFQVASLEGFGLKGFTCGIQAAAAVMSFFNHTQKTNLKHIKRIRPYKIEQYLEMDFTTRRNLELSTTMRDGRREGSLLSVLDACCTSMGRRTLRSWIEQPLRDTGPINLRLDAVEELFQDLALRSNLKDLLRQVYDLERLAGRIGSGLATPKDLVGLKASLPLLQELLPLLSGCKSDLLKEIAHLDPLSDIADLLQKSLRDDAPFSPKEGNIIKSGYNQEIDELREISQQGSNWLVEFESREKQRTGIKNLKVGFNRVFGYYIEITKSNLKAVPANYHRKQTLVNTERFICEELKEYEDRILGARERLLAMEYNEFVKIREQLVGHLSRIQAVAREVATLDVIYSLAQVAYNNNYVRPQVDASGLIEVRGGRHPVVEKSLTETRFVPNDIKLGSADARFAIITGPNMGGKSTFMRQIALLVVMAQLGSFVPADQAHIGVVDKVFTRVGAADDLAAGQSTFMVEMVEVANILHNATGDSLVILDEIGRGTSTYDGLSVAQAVSEYIIENIGSKTLFATHYHEITSLSQLHGAINLSVSVKETGDTVVFLKKVLPGKADKSYGLHVAQLAGIPEKVIQRAKEVLAGLESADVSTAESLVSQPTLFAEENPVMVELKKLDVDELTPRDALRLLYNWKQLVET